MDRRRFHDFTNSGFTKSYRNIYISIYKSKKYITLFIYQYWIYNRFNFSTNFCSISLCVSNYKNNIYFNIFFVYYIIVSINFLVGWIFSCYLSIIFNFATGGRDFNVASSTQAYSILGLFFFWIVPVGLYFLVTTPWWQPWAKKEKWYNPDDDKAAHPDRG